MHAPQFREVVPEDRLDVEGHQKAPDYTFRVGTLAKFYAEAKECTVNIAADPAPVFQIRRYGFSGKLARSILTDAGTARTLSDLDHARHIPATLRPRWTAKPPPNSTRSSIQWLQQNRRCMKRAKRLEDWQGLWHACGDDFGQGEDRCL